MLIFTKTRLEALSDGLFAIVLTLLVLELKVPDLPRDAPVADLLRELARLGPTLFSFLITFLLGGSFWLWHHSALHHVTGVTRRLLVLNLAVLFFVSLPPFSAALLGHFFIRQPLVVTLYFANQLAIVLFLELLWRNAVWQRLVADPESEDARALLLRLNGLLFGVVAATVLAPVNPSWLSTRCPRERRSCAVDFGTQRKRRRGQTRNSGLTPPSLLTS